MAVRRWLGRVWHSSAVLVAFALVVGALGAAPGRAGAAVPLQSPLVQGPASPAGVLPDPPGCTGNTQVAGPILVVKPIPDATDSTHPGVLTSTTSVPLAAQFIYTTHISVTVAITHTFSGDLQLFLISPRGTRVSLSTNNGSSLHDIYDPATFDDRAGLTRLPGPVTLATFTNGVGMGLVNPEEPLSAVNGEDPHGTWTLEVRDSVHTNTGVLIGWKLEVTALDSVPFQVLDSDSTFGPPQPIPDGGAPVDTQYFLSLPAPISALTLTTVITHPQPSDLVIELITPTGVTLTVSSHNGLNYNNLFAGTHWYDAAGAVNPPGPVTDNSFISGTVATPLSPQEGFAEANGLDTGAGNFHLIVHDTQANGKSGTLASSTLTAMALTCLPDLQVGENSVPRFPRAGAPMQLEADTENRAAQANDVLLTLAVGAPAGFLLVAPQFGETGWSCAPLPVGTLFPKVDCVRANVPPNGDFGVNMRVSGPLPPQKFAYTVTASSSTADLDPFNNTDTEQARDFVQSANGNPWDVVDSLNADYGFPNGGGQVLDGGQEAFGGFGGLKVAVLTLGGSLLGAGTPANFGLAYSPGHRWTGHAEYPLGGMAIGRDILAPAGANWLRYADHFRNNNGSPVRVLVSWGGELGSASQTKTAATSDGNLTLSAHDTWAVTFDQNQPNGPALHPPVGLAFRSPSDSSYQGPFIFNNSLFTQTVWPSLGNGAPGQLFNFVLQPGQTRTLAYFVARGLSESQPGPQDCAFYGGCATPPTGSQVTLIENTVAALAANPPFCDLSPTVLASLVNWPQVVQHCLYLPTLLR